MWHARRSSPHGWLVPPLRPLRAPRTTNTVRRGMSGFSFVKFAPLCAIWNAECWGLKAWNLRGGVVQKCHFMIFYVYCFQSCFLNDHYSSSFHPIGKQMKIEYLRLGLGSTCLGVASLQKLALPSSLALSSGGAKRYQLHSIANGRLHASCKLNL